MKMEVGKQFARLTAVQRAFRRNGMTSWLFKCECGGQITTVSRSVMAGRTKSCGCLAREMRLNGAIKHSTHGMTRGGKESPEYRAWRAMKTRCYNHREPDFINYGARGIKVCDEWRNNYLAFLAAAGSRPSPQHSIDHIDNSGDYAPGNIRWATRSEQNKNRRPFKRGIKNVT